MSERSPAIVVVGHVDHGKSTLIGRMLHETGSLPEGKLAELEASSKRRGVPMEWSFVLDALQMERDQAVTVDTTRVWMRAGDRRYAIIDAPGHRQFISNMLSGAAEADAAILMIDAIEGVSEQTRRHAYLLRLLGIEQVVVAVNKMDAVDWSEERFQAVARECGAYLAELQITASAIIPISAYQGVNLVARSAHLSWYTGPTLLEAFGRFVARSPAHDGPLRLLVQDVYRRGTRRIVVGRIDSGSFAVGDTVLVSPAGITATVESFETWPSESKSSARAGESVGFCVDRPLYIERGDVISHESDSPHRAGAFDATLFWLDESGPDSDESFRIQLGPTESRVWVEAIERVVDTENLAQSTTGTVSQYSVLDARLRTNAPVPLDIGGRVVLLRGSHVVAGGLVSRVASATRATNLYPQQHLVSRHERAVRNGHTGAVIWLTGLSASGKSTLAMAVERRLFARGCFVYVLDGDNVRAGINRDLGFSAEDRAENIRRVGEVAALFADAGAIVVTAFISPFRKDRDAARASAGSAFHEIYVSADLATCEARDPKGLYRRARSGEVKEFTGVTAPYEPPESAELVIDTSKHSIDDCVEQLYAYAYTATRLSLQKTS
ncbi:MAG TPA: adenylyl-sulfate kinase [Candidatus Baltobacteraceae bacterium]|jgi:bifunctional enzyme CysN/CysC